MSESAPPQTPPRHAPIALWQAAHALLTALFNLFGAPEQIAAQGTLTKPARALLLTWLRAAEAIVRRLIFIEAHKLGAREPPPSRPRGARKVARTRERPAFDPAAPETWRVSFRCSPPTSRRALTTRTRRHRPPRQIFARPLAERCEALLRAFNNPAPHALHLARHQRRKNSRVHDEPPPNTRDLYGRELYDTLDFHYRAAFHGIDTG
jgi:hypothetical protein